MNSESCPHCRTKVRQSRDDGRCVACGKPLPETLRALSLTMTAQVLPPTAYSNGRANHERLSVLDCVLVCLAFLAFITLVPAAIVGLPMLVVGLLTGISWVTITGAVLCATFLLALTFISWFLGALGRHA